MANIFALTATLFREYAIHLSIPSFYEMDAYLVNEIYLFIYFSWAFT